MKRMYTYYAGYSMMDRCIHVRSRWQSMQEIVGDYYTIRAHSIREAYEIARRGRAGREELHDGIHDVMGLTAADALVPDVAEG